MSFRTARLDAVVNAAQPVPSPSSFASVLNTYREAATVDNSTEGDSTPSNGTPTNFQRLLIDSSFSGFEVGQLGIAFVLLQFDGVGASPLDSVALSDPGWSLLPNPQGDFNTQDPTEPTALFVYTKVITQNDIDNGLTVTITSLVDVGSINNNQLNARLYVRALNGADPTRIALAQSTHDASGTDLVYPAVATSWPLASTFDLRFAFTTNFTSVPTLNGYASGLASLQGGASAEARFSFRTIDPGETVDAINAGSLGAAHTAYTIAVGGIDGEENDVLPADGTASLFTEPALDIAVFNNNDSIQFGDNQEEAIGFNVLVPPDVTACVVEATHVLSTADIVPAPGDTIIYELYSKAVRVGVDQSDRSGVISSWLLVGTLTLTLEAKVGTLQPLAFAAFDPSVLRYTQFDTPNEALRAGDLLALAIVRRGSLDTYGDDGYLNNVQVRFS